MLNNTANPPKICFDVHSPPDMPGALPSSIHFHHIFAGENRLRTGLAMAESCRWEFGGMFWACFMATRALWWEAGAVL
jgi:hypothetical protein